MIGEEITHKCYCGTEFTYLRIKARPRAWCDACTKLSGTKKDIIKNGLRPKNKVNSEAHHRQKRASSRSDSQGPSNHTRLAETEIIPVHVVDQPGKKKLAEAVIRVAKAKGTEETIVALDNLSTEAQTWAIRLRNSPIHFHRFDSDLNAGSS